MFPAPRLPIVRNAKADIIKFKRIGKVIMVWVVDIKSQTVKARRMFLIRPPGNPDP